MGYTLKLSQDVLDEKMSKLKPENIKKGVTIFDIIGECEGLMTQAEYDEAVDTIADILENSTPVPPSKGDVKLFDTIEHMHEDPNKEKDDLAIVYREEVSSLQQNSVFKLCKFYNTVVLDEAFSDDIYGYTEPIDDDIYIESYYHLNATEFVFAGFYETSVNIRYSSQDGITYTRVDGGDEEDLIDLGIYVTPDQSLTLNPIIGRFVKIAKKQFDGLFNADLISQEDKISIPLFIDVPEFPSPLNYNSEIVIQNKFRNVYDLTKLKTMVELIYDENFSQYTGTSKRCSLFIDSEGDLNIAWLFRTYDNKWDNLAMTNHFNYSTNNLTTELSQESYGMSADPKVKAFKVYKVNLVNMTYSERSSYSYEVKTIVGSFDKTWFIISQGLDINSLVYNFSVYSDSINVYCSSFKAYTSSSTSIKSLAVKILPGFNYYKVDYKPARNQFDAEQEDVYGKDFMGKNGVETGTLNNITDLNKEQLYTRILVWNRFNNLTVNTTNINGLFDGAPYGNSISNSLITIPNINTSIVTDMAFMFRMCYNLSSVPNFNTVNVVNFSYVFECNENLSNIPNFNLSNVTNMNGTFYNCKKITSIPQFNLKNVIHMYSTFEGCSNLVDLPYMNIYNCIDVAEIIQRCPNLSNDSLNNIMGTIASARNITWHSKVMEHAGFTNNQINICHNLSNYQALRNKGWQDHY